MSLFGPSRNELTAEYRKLHNSDRYMYCSSCFINVESDCVHVLN
jgi:hypothetical protein